MKRKSIILISTLFLLIFSGCDSGNNNKNDNKKAIDELIPLSTVSEVEIDEDYDVISFHYLGSDAEWEYRITNENTFFRIYDQSLLLPFENYFEFNPFYDEEVYFTAGQQNYTIYLDSSKLDGISSLQYDTTDNEFYVFDGNEWYEVSDSFNDMLSYFNIAYVMDNDLATLKQSLQSIGYDYDELLEFEYNDFSYEDYESLLNNYNSNNTSNNVDNSDEVANPITESLYGVWTNLDGYYNFALDSDYVYEFEGQFALKNSWGDGFTLYSYEIISAEYNDPNYTSVMGNGYYVLMDLFDNTGSTMIKHLFYFEDEYPDTIYEMTSVTGTAEGFSKSDPEKYVSQTDIGNPDVYVFSKNDEELAKKGSYSSRELVTKAFIGIYKPLPDYDGNSGIPLQTFAVVEDCITVDRLNSFDMKETNYGDFYGKSFVSAYNDPNFISLGGDGYYVGIQLNDSSTAVLLYKENLNDDLVYVYRSDNATSGIGDYGDPYLYYMARKLQ